MGRYNPYTQYFPVRWTGPHVYRTLRRWQFSRWTTHTVDLFGGQPLHTKQFWLFTTQAICCYLSSFIPVDPHRWISPAGGLAHTYRAGRWWDRPTHHGAEHPHAHGSHGPARPPPPSWAPVGRPSRWADLPLLPSQHGCSPRAWCRGRVPTVAPPSGTPPPGFIATCER